jgi:uncharacterized protein YciI
VFQVVIERSSCNFDDTGVHHAVTAHAISNQPALVTWSPVIGKRAGRRAQYRFGMALFVVRLERGGPWDWSRDMREQDGWDEHARFMDGLVDAGFILLGGPLEGDRDTLHVVDAASETAVRERLAEDPWARNSMLRPIRIERWTVVLDGAGLNKTLSHARKTTAD